MDYSFDRNLGRTKFDVCHQCISYGKVAFHEIEITVWKLTIYLSIKKKERRNGVKPNNSGSAV